MKVGVARTSGRKDISQQVPGLSDVEEGVVHLEEELPGDFLQSQQVLFKQRNHQTTHQRPAIHTLSPASPSLSIRRTPGVPCWTPSPQGHAVSGSQETTR